MPTDRPRAVAGTRGSSAASVPPPASIRPIELSSNSGTSRGGGPRDARPQWIFREPALAARKSALIWTAAQTDDELAEWTDAAGLSRTIRSGLRRD
jgi:hypothetical protein